MDPKVSDYMDIVDGIGTNAKTAELFLKNNPELFTALQAGLTKELGGGTTGFIQHLPKCVQNRINALKNVQLESAYLEGEFYAEAHQLEMKYAQLFKPLYEKRNDIVNAKYEPTEEESTWVEPGEEDRACAEQEEKKSTEEEEPEEKTEDEKMAESVMKELKLDENTKGIPEFWLTAMKNVELINEMIQEQDEPILKHLTDIKLIFTGKKGGGGGGGGGNDNNNSEAIGFVLEFHFSPNEFFSNSVLPKTYKMVVEPDTDDPFAFDGPDITACTGCKIDWKSQGKNVTRKQVRKKEKFKGKGQTRMVNKMVKVDSFFNFFAPPEVRDGCADDLDEETEALLVADFDVGHFFRERLIPKAVLFFTGDAIEEESDDEDDEDEDEETTSDEEDEELDDEEDSDPEYKPEDGGKKPEECKQQ